MGTNRQIAKNISYNLVTFATTLVINFFFTPYLIRTVGKEAYGFVPLVNNLIGYASIITAAVGSMAGRFITMSYYHDDKEGACAYFNSVFIANTFLSILFSIVGLVFVFFIDSVLNVPSYLLVDVQWLFFFALTGMVISLSTSIFGIGTYTKNRIDISSFWSMITEFIRVGLILLLFWILKPTIVFMSLSALLASVVSIFVNFHYKRVLIPEIKFSPRKYYSFSKVRELVSSGIWNSVNMLSNIMTVHVDLLITNIFINAATVGDYSIAKTIPGVLSHASGVISTTFTPHFNILYAKGQIRELVHEVKKSMIIIGFMTSIPIGFMLIDADHFMNLWIGNAFNDTILHLSFLSVLPMAINNTAPIFGVFTITNNRKVPAFVLLVVGILNIAIVFVLLKTTSLGVYAIAITGGGLLTLRNVFFTAPYGSHCLGIKKREFIPSILRGFLAIVVVVAVSIVIRVIMVVDSWPLFFLEFCLVAIVSSLINFYVILNSENREYLVGVLKSKLHLQEHL